MWLLRVRVPSRAPNFMVKFTANTLILKDITGKVLETYEGPVEVTCLYGECEPVSISFSASFTGTFTKGPEWEEFEKKVLQEIIPNLGISEDKLISVGPLNARSITIS